MNAILVDCPEPLTLVGGGAADGADLAAARQIAPRVVAADGGARLCLDAGVMPEMVIGDMDSLDPADQVRIPAGRLCRIAEQDSTDFDKALRSVQAPLILGIGFLGKRIDHQLSALNRLAARPDKAVLLLDREDVVCHLPPRLSLMLDPGLRLSLFPLRDVTGRSAGLEWPIDGLRFGPSGRVGTSNRVTGPVTIDMHGPGMLLIVPRACLTPVAKALRDAAPWPVPGQ